MKKISDFAKDFSDIMYDNGRKDVFNLEITTTEKCNMRCTYCFEGERIQHSASREYENNVISAIDNLITNMRFLRKYKHLNITMWGGEPTINTDFICRLIERYSDKPAISWYIYTNGMFKQRIVQIIKLLKEKGISDRATFQVSWDGVPVHDMHRFTLTGRDSSFVVMDTIREIVKQDCNLSLKSAILPEDFKYMPDVWKSYKDFLESLLGADFTNSNITYAPTIDQTYKQGSIYADDLKKALAEIVVMERDFIKVHKAPLLMWFDNDMKVCRYRSGMCCIGVDGNVYSCHGVMYDDKVKCYETVGNIADESLAWFDNVSLASQFSVPDKCIMCPATYCAVCCVQSSSMSDKENTFDKWYDRTVQNGLCRYYGIVGAYSKALHKLVVTGEA